jgi:hypothetical protein
VEPVPGATTGSADAAVALRSLAGRVAAIRLPPADLPGWSSLCAAEYRDAVRRLAGELDALHAALEAAIRAAASP